MAGIPVTASLPGQPSLREMVVSASRIHRVIKSKDLEQLAKQMYKERKQAWEKRQLSKRFPPPPSKPPVSPPPPPESLESPPAAEPSPEEKQPGPDEEEPGPEEDEPGLEEEEDLVEPKPLKFRKIGEELQLIQQSGEATGSVHTLGWEEDFEPQPASGGGEEDNEMLSEEVPTITSAALGWEEDFEPQPASGGGEEDNEMLSEEVPTVTSAALGWEEDFEPQPASEGGEKDNEMLSEEVPTLTSVALPKPLESFEESAPLVNPKPPQLDLSTITPTPVYVPETQPAHLNPVALQKQEKKALEYYQEVQKDVKKVMKGGGELKDQDEIISARPDGRVTLKDGQNGLIEVKSPTSAKHMTVSEAVRKKRINFLVRSEAAGETEFMLKRRDNYYHQVQAEIYAGAAYGYDFCDFVVYLKEAEDGISVERISPDVEWQRTNVPKVRQFCDIYNKLLKEDTAGGV